ncbi:hypothetical protein DEU56DRAFT_977616 [Suillus clintonianus]|uniref:uncharacterized protein n=1 Tax=Suillus clintonianus TaxID=1904413 RepID=UPI001B875E7A|nr:uncharacterized protein DEU56DRAFT_977616 [Suillus clintonianus]KAG2150928.1 hypothetical protein DEU56DRAFT_977616 [Suillus clintonianus]
MHAKTQLRGTALILTSSDARAAPSRGPTINAEEGTRCPRQVPSCNIKQAKDTDGLIYPRMADGSYGHPHYKAVRPPASLDHFDFDRRQPEKPCPTSPAFYTARPECYDQLSSLESAVQHTKTALTTCHLLPLPQFAREALPPRVNAWVDKRELGLKAQTEEHTHYEPLQASGSRVQ